MKYAPWIFLLMAALSLCACSNRETQRLLDRAEAVMNDNPGEAIAVLDSIGDDGLTRSQRMRRLLLLTNAQNKCDTVFRSDSIQRMLVEYYDSHGTANERMLAYYLLGRALYDMGEVPAALESFQDAVSSADTTSKSCDYRLLSRVHGQTARLFLEQEAPDNSFDQIKSAKRYAELSLDTPMAMAMMAQIPLVYEMENKYDSIIIISEQIYEAYKELGFMTEAARALGPSIEYLVQADNLPKARHNMDIFEKYSGWYNNGDICQGHEIYFYIKGMYFLKSKSLDSAEYYFRKELSSVKLVNEKIMGNQGLCQLYEQKSILDSMAKYAINCQVLTNQYYDELSTANIQRLQSAYNYNRFRKMADEKETEAKEANFKSIILILILALTLTMLICAVAYYRQKKKEFLQNEKLLYDKLKRIELSQQELNSEIEAEKHEMKLLQSDIVIHFRDIANISREKVSSKDWLSLSKMVSKELPTFYSTICMSKGLRQEEINVCMLIRLQFKPKEICNLTGLSPQVVTNMRKRMLNKIFGKSEGGSRDFDVQISQIR